MVKTLSAADQEALLDALIRKISLETDPHRLRESSTLTLALLLRRDGDADLRAGLTRRIDDIIAEIQPGQSEERTGNQVRFAARQCVKVLQAAKDRRVPRAAGASGNWARDAAPARSAAGQRFQRNTHYGVAALVALTLLGGGATLLWRPAEQRDEGVDSPLTAEIRVAAEGTGPATHGFGGALTVTTVGGRPMVTAEAVPAKACVTAGWQLVRKGVLSINGVTPLRVSAARLAELCNSAGGLATITWMPKPRSE
jgi:hypothetical protein